MIEILIILTLIWLIFAIIQDFKFREIANWLNFSLIIFALAIRLFYSIFSSNYDYLIFGIFGLAIFFIVGHLFYYSRVFAGGDAKLLIAFGAIIPIANTFYENTLILGIFVIALLFTGAIYSLIYSFIISFINRKKFAKEFIKQIKINRKHFYLTAFFAVLLLFLTFILNQAILLVIPIIILIFPILFTYTKAVENSSMIKLVDIKHLTVGDWLVKSIKVKSKTIKANWEGIDEEQLKLIQKNYKKKVLIKYGIPFSPSFLFALLVLLGIKYFWNSNWGFW